MNFCPIHFNCLSSLSLSLSLSSLSLPLPPSLPPRLPQGAKMPLLPYPMYPPGPYSYPMMQYPPMFPPPPRGFNVPPTGPRYHPPGHRSSTPPQPARFSTPSFVPLQVSVVSFTDGHACGRERSCTCIASYPGRGEGLVYTWACTGISIACTNGCISAGLCMRVRIYIYIYIR